MTLFFIDVRSPMRTLTATLESLDICAFKPYDGASGVGTGPAAAAAAISNASRRKLVPQYHTLRHKYGTSKRTCLFSSKYETVVFARPA